MLVWGNYLVLLLAFFHHVQTTPTPIKLEKMRHSLVVVEAGIDPPIFYTAYFPIIYKFPIPKFTQDNLKSLIHGQDTSILDEHLSSVYEQAVHDLQDSVASTPPASVTCGEVLPHFGFRNGTTWTDYISILSRCQIRRVFQKTFNKFNFDQSQVDGTMHLLSTALEGLYWQEETQYVFHALTASARVLNYIAALEKLANSLRVCPARRIPKALVDASDLGKMLEAVTDSLENDHNPPTPFTRYALSSENVEQHYQLPIADCAYSIDNKTNVGTMGIPTLILRTLVPIIPLNYKSHKLMRITPIPFTKSFSITSSTNLICGLDNLGSGGRSYLVDENIASIQKIECKAGDLCFLTKQEEFENDACLEAIIREDQDQVGSDSTKGNNLAKDVVENCQLSCHQVQTDKFPIVRKIASDTFAIVGLSLTNREVYIACTPTPLPLLPFQRLKLTDHGVLVVRLACACNIINHFEDFHPEYPCGNETNVLEVEGDWPASFEVKVVNKIKEDDAAAKILNLQVAVGVLGAVVCLAIILEISAFIYNAFFNKVRATQNYNLDM